MAPQEPLPFTAENEYAHDPHTHTHTIGYNTIGYNVIQFDDIFKYFHDTTRNKFRLHKLSIAISTSSFTPPQNKCENVLK